MTRTRADSLVTNRYVQRGEWLQNGFPTASDVSITWTDSTPDRTLTVAPSGTSYDYYIQGIKYTETGSLTKQIGSGVVGDEGLWVFYFDSEGVIAATQSPSSTQIDTVIETKAIIAYVYWDATNSDGRLMYELHGSNMAPATHHWLHDNMGAQYKDGMALGDFVIDDDGNDAADAQFSVATGNFYDEDIAHSLSAIASTTGLEIWYLDSSDWRWTTNAGYSVLTYSGGSNLLAYNNAGAQAEVTNNTFVLCHVFATNITADDGTSPKFIAVQGQAEYATLALARAGADTEINALVFGTLPLEEVIPVGTVIFQTKTTYGNAVKARTVTTASGDNYVDWRSASLKSTGGSVSDHGSLAGLADDDHQQYILHSLADAANDFLVASAADTFVKKTLAETGAILEGDIDHANLQNLGTGADHSYIDQDVTSGSAPTFTGTNITAVASVTAANEATDTTCFPVFVTDATGTVAAKTNANFTLNSNTGALAAPSFTATGEVQAEHLHTTDDLEVGDDLTFTSDAAKFGSTGAYSVDWITNNTSRIAIDSSGDVTGSVFGAWTDDTASGWRGGTAGGGSTWETTTSIYYTRYMQVNKLTHWAFYYRADMNGVASAYLTLTSPVAPAEPSTGTTSWFQTGVGYINGAWQGLYFYWDETNNVWLIDGLVATTFNASTRQDVCAVLTFEAA